MSTFCDVLHETKREQTLESAQYGLEIIFTMDPPILANS